MQYAMYDMLYAIMIWIVSLHGSIRRARRMVGEPRAVLLQLAHVVQLTCTLPLLRTCLAAAVVSMQAWHIAHQPDAMLAWMVP